MSTFEYFNGIPNGPNNPSADQPLMQINTNSIDSIIGVDHNTFESGTNNDGFHTVIHFQNQLADPPNVPGVLQLYSKSAGSPSTPALFIFPPGAAAGIQLTQFLTPVVSANGYTFIPGGIILQWGNFNPNVSISVTFPLTFPNTVFNIQLTGSASNNSTFRNGVSTGSLNTSGFSWQGTIDPHWTPIYWFAIGN